MGFNDITHQFEKQGGNQIHYNDRNPLIELVDKTGALKIQAIGLRFTW